MTLAERPRRSREFLARIGAAAILTAAACAPAPLTAQVLPHPSPPVADIGPTIETLDANRGTGVYPVFASADLQAG
jgi:hypothetical protein